MKRAYAMQNITPEVWEGAKIRWNLLLDRNRLWYLRVACGAVFDAGLAEKSWEEVESKLDDLSIELLIIALTSR